MYCPYCGKENKDISQFCTGCGKKLTDETGRYQNAGIDAGIPPEYADIEADRTTAVHKKRHGKVFAVILVVLVILLVLGAFFGKVVWKSHQWKEYYDLGSQYLTEENYEEAVVAFTNAIEIDEKRPEAYVGRGDAYAGSAEETEDTEKSQKLYEAAIKDYEQAAELGSENVSSRLDIVQNDLEEVQKMAEYRELLEPVYKFMSSKEYGDLTDFLYEHEEEYAAISDKSSTDSPVCYKGIDGKVLAVYPDDYYYFGEWTDNQRSGEGQWIRINYRDNEDFRGYNVYEGQWSGDKPNGEGIVTVAATQDPEAGYEKETCRGSFKDGVYHGSFEIKDSRNFYSVEWEDVQFENGVALPYSDPNDSEYSNPVYYPNGSYVIAVGADMNELCSSSDKVWTVPGFETE